MVKTFVTVDFPIFRKFKNWLCLRVAKWQFLWAMYTAPTVGAADAEVLRPEHVAPDSEGHTPSELARLEGFEALARWGARKIAFHIGYLICPLQKHHENMI